MFRISIPFLLAALACLPAIAVAGDIYIRYEAGQNPVLSNVPQGDGFSVLLADPQQAVVADLTRLFIEPTPLAPVLSGTLLERARRFGPWVDEAARESKLDARLLHAVIAAESAYNPAALSPKGAVGIMQLLPATARRYGVADSLDARQNIRGGARYLADLLRLFSNDTRLALAAYNAGENAVWRHGGKIPPYRETEAYVPRVLAFYRRFESTPL